MQPGLAIPHSTNNFVPTSVRSLVAETTGKKMFSHRRELAQSTRTHTRWCTLYCFQGSNLTRRSYDEETCRQMPRTQRGDRVAPVASP